MARIVYLMGASGVGKDSLLHYVRQRTDATSPWIVAHRYITRAPNPQAENHIALTDSEFQQRLDAGLFALAWASHGFRYGIGVEVHDWLASGLNVVLNGSRAYLAEARRRYPDLLPVKVTVSPSVLKHRLCQRGREPVREIEGRLQRGNHFDDINCPGLKEIRNDGVIDVAGSELLALCAGTDAGR